MASKRKKDLPQVETTNPAMTFIVEELRKRPEVSYADLRAKAETRDLTIYPIMYGRAKALLGLVASKPRGTGKAATKTREAREAREANGSRQRAAPGGDHFADLESFIKQARADMEDATRLREFLSRIRDEIGHMLD